MIEDDMYDVSIYTEVDHRIIKRVKLEGNMRIFENMLNN